MSRLKQDYDQFTARGAGILAVGPDGPTSFRRYWETNQIPFAGLPDPDHGVARRYRQEVNIFKLGRMPLVTVIDRDGFIRYAHYGASMSDIPESGILLDVIDRLNKASK